MSLDLPGARRCADTGLLLVPATGQVTWRVGKTAYGPLSPQLRDNTSAKDWNRFDIHNGRTLYSASTRECAYSEVLDPLKRARPGPTKDAAFLGRTPGQFAAQVATDWARNNVAPPGDIDERTWRTNRTLWALRLPTTGWWVHLEDPDSMAATEKAIPAQLAAAGAPTLDVSVLRGTTNRIVTVTLADWVHSLPLDDGTHPLGIHYYSRHATGASWAYWLREPAGTPPPEVLSEHTIDLDDLDLVTVTQRFGITLR